MHIRALAILLLQGCCSAPAQVDTHPIERVQPPPEGPSLVRGTVTLKGQAPKQKLINPAAFEGIQGQRPVGLRSERVVVDQNNHIQWAFVYVKKGLEGKRFSIPALPVLSEIDGYRFNPHAFGIVVGQPLVIRNMDATLHTFHTTGNFNPNMVGLPVKGEVKETRFAQPEVMASVQCDVHPWERSWVGVLPHPFCAVTGPDGSYEIRGLPPGHYLLEVWHEYYMPVTLEVVVTEGKTFVADFVLEERKDQ